MTFRLSALPYAPFATLFDADERARTARLARLVVADACPGYPCRVSLVDATPGERVLLINHAHQPAASPFRATHAIYVRENARQATPAVGEIPPLFLSRILSLRGFDDGGNIVAADLADGKKLADALDGLLSVPTVSYVHLHYAKLGCYAARADRA